MALTFSWAEIWEYYDSITDPEIKAQLQKEIVGQDWLATRSAKEQKRVLEGAPKEFLDSVRKVLRPEVQIVLGYNPYA